MESGISHLLWDIPWTWYLPCGISLNMWSFPSVCACCSGMSHYCDKLWWEIPNQGAMLYRIQLLEAKTVLYLLYKYSVYEVKVGTNTRSKCELMYIWYMLSLLGFFHQVQCHHYSLSSDFILNDLIVGSNSSYSHLGPAKMWS